MGGGHFAFFEDGINPVDYDADGGGAHGFHRLADRGQRWGVDCRGRNVVKADYRALFGDADAGFVQCSDRAEGAHVVESEKGGERALGTEQVFGEFVAHFEAGQRIAGFGHVHDHAVVEFEVALLGEIADAAPARRAVGKGLGSANESDLAMAERMQVLEGEVASDFVVDDDGADGIGFELASDHRCRDAALFKITQQVDVEEDPVGDYDQGLDAAVEEHLEVTLEAAALVVDVCENREVGSLIERVLDAAENHRTEGVGHVEDHDADGVAALAAERAGELVGTVSEPLGGAFDALLSDGRDVARQRCVVQDDRHRGRGEAAFLRHITNGYHREAGFKVSKFQSFKVALWSYRQLGTQHVFALRGSLEFL